MRNKGEAWKTVRSHYERVFSIPWGETWYSSVMTPLALSAQEHESLSTSRPEWPRCNEWQPYELIIETQVGLALVLAQTYLTNVISQVQNLHSDYKAVFGSDLNGFKTVRAELLRHSASFYEDTRFTKVEAIEHLANYFKHHQEWGGRSKVLGRQAARTAAAVKELGVEAELSLWFSRSLTNSVRSLGVSSPRDLPMLLRVIDDWKGEVGVLYRPVLTQELSE